MKSHLVFCTLRNQQPNCHLHVKSRFNKLESIRSNSKRHVEAISHIRGQNLTGPIPTNNSVIKRHTSKHIENVDVTKICVTRKYVNIPDKTLI